MVTTFQPRKIQWFNMIWRSLAVLSLNTCKLNEFRVLSLKCCGKSKTNGRVWTPGTLALWMYPVCCCLLTPVHSVEDQVKGRHWSRFLILIFVLFFTLLNPHIRRPNPPPTKYVKRNILSRVERVWNFKFSLSLTKCHFWHIWLELSTRLGRLAFALSDLGPIFAPRAPYSGALPPLTTWASLFTQNQMCQMIKRKVHIIKMHSQTYSQSQIQQDGGNVFCSSRFLFWSHFSDLHILKYRIGKFQYNLGWTCIQF